MVSCFFSPAITARNLSDGCSQQFVQFGQASRHVDIFLYTKVLSFGRILQDFCLLVHYVVYSEQGWLWCVSPASKARPASNLASQARSALASKARSAPASKARTAEVWPGPPLNLPFSVSDSRLRLLLYLHHNVRRAYTITISQPY
eukprot:6213784-Pleurochrysis_carterae.AAC.1